MKTETKNKEKSSKRRILTFSLIAFFVLIVLLIFVDLIISNFTLRTTEYYIENYKINKEIRIVQISDLHEKNFGKDNKKLIEEICEASPDLIVFTGDIIERTGKDDPTEYLTNLLKKLRDVAPIYFCLGNHEESSPYFQVFKDTVARNGATLLDDSYTDISIKGQNIRIGALSYYRSWYVDHHRFLKDFSDTENFTLLLCHYPEYYVWGVKRYPIDLMLSGHTHGGMIRLPFMGGLYAPEQGWFPECDKGLFDDENATIIISAGLGSSPSYLPRFSNPPEIVSVTIN